MSYPRPGLMPGYAGLGLKTALFCILIILMQISTGMSTEVAATASVESRLEYNDNILFSRTDPYGDMIFLVKPGLNLGYEKERLELKSRISAEILYYREHSDLDNEYISMNAGGRMTPAEKYQMNADVSFIKDITLDSEASETGILATRDDRDTFNAGGGISYYLSEPSNIGVEYSFRKVDYASEDSAGYKGNYISLSYNRRMLNIKDAITLNVYYSGNESETYQVGNIGLSGVWSRRINETWSLSAFLGARRTKTSYLFGGIFLWEEKKWGGVADISLEKSGDTWSMDAGWSRNLSFGVYGDPIDTDRLSLNVRKNFSEGLSGVISGSFSRGRSASDLSVSLKHDSWHLSLGPSLRYRIAEEFTLDLSYCYSYARDRLLETSGGVGRNTFRIALKYEFMKKF